MFSNYPRSLDFKNIAYTVAELVTNTTESPYPNLEMNSPPGGPIDYSTYPAKGANYHDYLIGVQSVVIDAKDRLWILDTGRALTPDGTNVPASYGGPKLIGVNLSNNSVFQTIVFPPTVAYSVSYLNDVRFDLRPNVTSSGQGVAYITDSSNEGRNGLVIVDLGTGISWRHLDGLPQVHPAAQFIKSIWGETVYSYSSTSSAQQISYETTGADGIALSADGSTLFFAPVSNRYLYSIPTSYLLDHSPGSELRAQSAVVSRGQKGCSDGLETDSNDAIYGGDLEQNAVNIFFPSNDTTEVFVRDPRIGWTDTMSIATIAGKGWLYFTENQLWRSPMYAPGTDRRVKPYVLFRAPLPAGGTKVLLT
ncbi:MAG: hypothetical protein M1819_000962 [Sarea resinae]|nr:MAG: hypothetical protein M1819_000962 [Sarea resinae]